MNAYTSDQLRNVVLMGHSGSGKTMLGEAMLFASGALSRLGRIEDGNTVGDFDEEEHARTYSISLSLLPVEWAGHRLNVIDTPGYFDFIGEVISAAAAADSAIVTVDAASAFVPRLFQIAGDAIRAIRIRESTLEDAYFDIVGASLSDQGVDG